MWAIFRRVLVPTLLLGAGIASLIHGAKFHVIPVYEEREIEIQLPPPPQFDGPGGPEGPDGPGGPGDPLFPGAPQFGGPPGGSLFPGMGPSPFPTTMKQKVLVAKDEPEFVLVREITYGGVALLENGQLKRTYTGTPPSLCPT